MLRPLLVEIRRVILEGDGSGRGKLASSGYQAEPAELELDLGNRTATSRAAFASRWNLTQPIDEHVGCASASVVFASLAAQRQEKRRSR